MIIEQLKAIVRIMISYKNIILSDLTKIFSFFTFILLFLLWWFLDFYMFEIYENTIALVQFENVTGKYLLGSKILSYVLDASTHLKICKSRQLSSKSYLENFKVFHCCFCTGFGFFFFVKVCRFKNENLFFILLIYHFLGGTILQGACSLEYLLNTSCNDRFSAYWAIWWSYHYLCPYILISKKTEKRRYTAQNCN